MDQKKASGHDKKKIIFILRMVLVNLVLGICIILSVVTALKEADKASFSQNIENVRTLTDASANKVELEINYHTHEVETVADYVNQYQGRGMKQEELCEYFQSMYSKNLGENYSWQLVDSVQNGIRGTGMGFNTIDLCNGTEQLCYHTQAYSRLVPTFAAAAEQNLGRISYTSEFTDVVKVEKSFAITTTVRVLSEKEASGYEYKTLMLLIRSDYINQLLADNNDTDILNFFNYSNIIIDNDGNYVISNNSFQGTNFIDYIELYNEDFTKEIQQQLCKNLGAADYSEVLYYQNSKGEDCAYTIVPVQESDWHILSIVPMKSFHNAYDFNQKFALFAIFFGLLSLFDIIFILSINQQLRRSTREAQAANYAKSEFLSAMSHDIRTPMNAIIGMTILAEEAIGREQLDVETLKDSIETIKHSGNHLLTLINDILDISKIENGKLVIAPENFSIRDNMNNMLEILDPELHKKDLKLVTKIDEIQHEYVYADELRINQIYINILSNAIKYTNPGGTIEVTLREEIESGKSGSVGAKKRARFFYQVKDTGIGMTPEFLKTIFDRFSRAVDTRVNVTQGTGLGMAISKQLVDLLGGTITVESEINKGSTFTVILDLEILDPEAVKVLQERKKTKQQTMTDLDLDLSVLVVEDNEINWKILNKLLIKYGIHANRAENGQVAVDLVKKRSQAYDVILMDVQMPLMNGYQATEAIRKIADPVIAATPIYAMTADTFAEDIAKCRAAGMNGHLAKPIELNKLEQILVELSRNVRR